MPKGLDGCCGSFTFICHTPGPFLFAIPYNRSIFDHPLQQSCLGRFPKCYFALHQTAVYCPQYFILAYWHCPGNGGIWRQAICLFIVMNIPMSMIILHTRSRRFKDTTYGGHPCNKHAVLFAAYIIIAVPHITVPSVYITLLSALGSFFQLFNFQAPFHRTFPFANCYDNWIVMSLCISSSPLCMT